jgi:hypothetical protein
MRIKCKIFALSVVISFAAVLLFCGGSEIGNPMVVVGAICDSEGKGLSSVELFLIDTSESDPNRLVADSCIQAYTGPDGSYRFSNVPEGNYNLFGYADYGNKMLLKRLTSLTDAVTVEDGVTTLEQGRDTIKSSAKVIIKVDACFATTDNYIFVPNTVIRVHVDSCGEYLVKVPATNVDLVFFSNDTQEVLSRDLSLSSGQWLDLTGKTYVVPKPVMTAGAVTGSIGKSYVYSAEQIDLGPNHPVQYRFDWGKSITLWDLTNTASHTWNTAGTYRVSIQARSIRDTLSLSKWSDSISVAIQ